MNAAPYTKLPGRGWTWTGRARAWLGEQHILLVTGRTFFESYRRFFFKDVQAVIVRRTHIGKIWSGVWALVFVFFAGIALAVNDPIGTPVLVGIAAPFGLAMIANLLLGPTCACYIRTAVQIERVPAVSRLRAARQFLAIVEPFIIEAQGQLSTEQIATELATLQARAGVPLANVP